MSHHILNILKAVSNSFHRVRIRWPHRNRSKSSSSGESGKNAPSQHRYIWDPQTETRLHPFYECGCSDYGFFKLYKTFTFGLFESASHQGFGSLRVLNHGWLTSEGVVPPHEHASYYIISFVLSGEATMETRIGDQVYKHTVSPGQIESTYCGDGIVRTFTVAPGKPPLNAVEFWIERSTRDEVPAVHLTEAADVFTQPNRFRPIVTPAPHLVRRDSDQTVVEPCNSLGKYTDEDSLCPSDATEMPANADIVCKPQNVRIPHVDSDTNVYMARLTPGAWATYQTARMLVECHGGEQCGVRRQRSAGWLGFLSNESSSHRSTRSATDVSGEDRLRQTSMKGTKGEILPNHRLIYIAVINSLDEFGDTAYDVGRIVIPGQLEISYGDGAYLSNVPCGTELEIANKGKDPATILIFDMDSNSALV